MPDIVEVEFEIGNPHGGWSADEILNPLPRIGWHVSTVARNLEKALGRQEFPDISDQQLNDYAELGFMWEQVFGRVFAQRQRIRNRLVVEQQAFEVCRHAVRLQDMEPGGPVMGDICPRGCGPGDGLWMSPDGFDIGNWTLEEYKCTWKSALRVATLEEDFWYWMVQMKAYAFGLKSLQARLFVYFVNNDWRPPRPKPRRFDLRFYPRELIENFEMLLAHRDRMIESGQEPPVHRI